MKTKKKREKKTTEIQNPIERTGKRRRSQVRRAVGAERSRPKWKQKNKTPKQKTKTKSGNVALKMTPKVEPREPSVENKIREGNQTNTKRKETVPSGTRGKLGNNKKKQPKTR